MGKKAEAPIITMAQADIPRAGRLNPRNRRAGGVGDSPDSLNLLTSCWDFDELDISSRGKVAVWQLIGLVWEIIKETNLAIRDDQQQLQGCKEILEEYLAEIAKIQEKFERVAADIACNNEDGQIIMGEMVKLKKDIRGLLNYCKIKTANGPAAGLPNSLENFVKNHI